MTLSGVELCCGDGIKASPSPNGVYNIQVNGSFTSGRLVIPDFFEVTNYLTVDCSGPSTSSKANLQIDVSCENPDSIRVIIGFGDETGEVFTGVGTIGTVINNSTVDCPGGEFSGPAGGGSATVS